MESATTPFPKLIPTGSSFESFLAALTAFYYQSNEKGAHRVWKGSQIITRNKSSKYFFKHLLTDTSRIINHNAWDYFLGKGLSSLTLTENNDVNKFLNSFDNVTSYNTWLSSFLINSDEISKFLLLSVKNDTLVTCPNKFKISLKPAINDMMLTVKESSFIAWPSFLLNNFTFLVTGIQSCSGLGFSDKSVDYYA